MLDEFMALVGCYRNYAFFDRNRLCIKTAEVIDNTPPRQSML